VGGAKFSLVEVVGRVAQLAHGGGDGLAIPREDGAGERVGGGLVALAQRLLEARVRVHVDAHQRREDLLLHDAVARVGELHHGGLHEPALAAVRVPARDDGGLRAALLRQLDVRGHLLEGLLVDDGAHEVAEVRHVAHAQLGDELLQARLELGPQGLGA
jgi:hypothetical protein